MFAQGIEHYCSFSVVPTSLRVVDQGFCLFISILYLNIGKRIRLLSNSQLHHSLHSHLPQSSCRHQFFCGKKRCKFKTSKNIFFRKPREMFQYCFVILSCCKMTKDYMNRDTCAFYARLTPIDIRIGHNTWIYLFSPFLLKL